MMSYDMNYTNANTSTSNNTSPHVQSVSPSPPSSSSTSASHNTTKNSLTFKDNVIQFLYSKSNTIMAHSIGFAIGFSFKELIASIINCILKPLIVYIIVVSHLQEYYDFASLIEEQKKGLSITSFISALLTFILLIITVYFINKCMTAELQSFS